MAVGVGVFGVDALGALAVGAHELVRLNLFLHLDRSRALSAASLAYAGVRGGEVVVVVGLVAVGAVGGIVVVVVVVKCGVGVLLRAMVAS